MSNSDNHKSDSKLYLITLLLTISVIIAAFIITDSIASRKVIFSNSPPLEEGEDATDTETFAGAQDFANHDDKDDNFNVDEHENDADDTSEELTADENSISIIMVGDILLHDGVNKCSRMSDGTYDYSALFGNTENEIAKADIALVNEEVIIGGSELQVSGYPSFNAPFEVADELADVGFDVICHATNHALDRGGKGIRNCLDYWKTNYPEISTVGIYDSQENSQELCIINRKNIKVAILNYTYGTNGIPLPESMPYAVNLLDEEKVIRDIEKAEAECDFTVVCPHWGVEYNLGISDMQRKWAQIFADAGADLIIGTHPHVIEPIEVVQGANGEEVPVFYSLGNYVNWTSGEGNGISNRMVGAMARIELDVGENGKPRIAQYGVLPLVCHVESKFGGVTTYFMEDYDEELALHNEILKRDRDFSYEYCLNLCNQIFEPQFVLKPSTDTN